MSDSSPTQPDGLPLRLHSLAELKYYCMLTKCPACETFGQAPLDKSLRAVEPGETHLIPARVRRESMAVVHVACAQCRESRAVLIEWVDGVDNLKDRPGASDRLNPTTRPSHVLDVGQWLVLYRTLLENASREPNRARARLLSYDAAQCVEEALKFFDDDNDLPPERSFFTETTLYRFRQHPQLFARSRLIHLRSNLPSLNPLERAFERAKSELAVKRPWWRWWS